VERRVVTVTEIFVFKRFQPVLYGLFEFDPEMTLSVIDPINLRYRDVIAAKKGTCEPVPNNLVTANKMSLLRASYTGAALVGPQARMRDERIDRPFHKIGGLMGIIFHQGLLMDSK
jgi:hypothetical protein